MHVFTWTRLDVEGGGDVLLGTAEHLLLHVDTAAGKASPADPAVLAALDRVAAAHAPIERPPAAGRHVGQRRDR
jgi:carnitine 3-dehydrogenase